MNVLPVIIGMAGHVDHGKSSIVRSLTQREPSRHKEERARGMTLDLSVVPFKVDDATVAGLVDVPGHKDYVRNALSGLASVDILVVVVAADDGIMPQTQEHLKAAFALGISSVCGVVSKVDRVSAERADEVVEDLRNELAKYGLEADTIVKVSAISGEGMEDLRSQIALMARTRASTKNAADRSFRMEVRHAFSVKGVGTVCTGIPRSGVIKVGDTMSLSGYSSKAVIRALHQYSEERNTVNFGSSVAVALRDVAVTDVSRGETLASPGVYPATKHCIIALDRHDGSVTNARRTIAVHLGTAHRPGQFRVLKAGLGQGETAVIGVRFSDGLILAPGDRVLISGLPEGRILGGGVVLALTEALPKSTAPGLDRRLEAALDGRSEKDFLKTQMMAGTTALLTTDHATAALGQPAGNHPRLRQAISDGHLVLARDDGWLVTARAEELHRKALQIVQQYHRTKPTSPGMPAPQLALRLGLGDKYFENARQFVLGSELLAERGRIRSASFRPAIPPIVAKWGDAALKRIRDAGIKSIARGDLFQALGLSAKDGGPLVRYFIDNEEAVLLEDKNLVVWSEFERCRETLIRMMKSEAPVELGAFRTATGASRQIAAALLDRFDLLGVSVRTEKGRVAGRSV